MSETLDFIEKYVELALTLRIGGWPAFKKSQRSFQNDGLIKDIFIHLHDGSTLQRSSATIYFVSGYPTYLKINKLENSPTIMRLCLDRLLAGKQSTRRVLIKQHCLHLTISETLDFI